jgi:hypothetical protein
MPYNEGAPPETVGRVYGKGSPQKDFCPPTEVTAGLGGGR